MKQLVACPILFVSLVAYTGRTSPMRNTVVFSPSESWVIWSWLWSVK